MILLNHYNITAEHLVTMAWRGKRLTVKFKKTGYGPLYA
jgi:hypothetical protein